MVRVLLIDGDFVHAEQLGLLLTRRGLTVVRAVNVEEAVNRLRERAQKCDIAMLIMSDRARPWLRILHDLQQAGEQATFLSVPLFLCVARVEFGVDFEIRIERMGARYVCEL